MYRIYLYDRLVKITKQKLKEFYNNGQLNIQNDETRKT